MQNEARCTAYGCTATVVRPRFFCDMHWKYLPRLRQKILADCYGRGTVWDRALRDTREYIARFDAAAQLD